MLLQHLLSNKHVLVRATHVSGWFLQILVIHVGWDDLRGQRTGGVWLRQLPFKLRLNEVQLPAGEGEIQKLAGNEWKFVSEETLDTHLCGRRKLLGNLYHSLPTHTLTGRPSGTE